MVLDTYAVHGGNLISIELHTLAHREGHEKEEHRACSQRGGGGRKREGKIHVSTCREAVDTLFKGMCHFQHIRDHILEQHTLCITTLFEAHPTLGLGVKYNIYLYSYSKKNILFHI